MKIIILLLSILSFISCNKGDSEKSVKWIKNSKGEVYIAILETFPWEGATPTFLTKKEVEEVNNILPKAVKKMNIDIKKMFHDTPTEWPNLIVNLEDYKRQYFPYINKKTKQKEVFVSCFCRVPDDRWKNEGFNVLGGGNCYFHGTINLSTGEFNDFMTNAPM
ncbi:hypothetical protein FLCU109888_08530 [Flavobacterium cucumis]|uniref:Uncharacterized protein n=1 Tax=Flavobacterium cucumis TaxID=416016 RepID=A0A1M7ZYA9_9FLAO|nr:hypothetical protein [Flavobacterium cucumis]SHO73858.1 hypothetical protein SAMN05443547_2233 [Flavobacterium cucumis]